MSTPTRWGQQNMEVFMEFDKVIQTREAVRKFDGTKPSDSQLNDILQAGRLAPTAMNAQPQRVLVLESKESLAKMDKVHRGRYGAELVLLVCVDTDVEISVNNESHPEIDGAIVATHMMLKAADIGVDTVWLGIFNESEVKKEFDLPANLLPICFLPLGKRAKDYAGNPMHNKRFPLQNMVKRV